MRFERGADGGNVAQLPSDDILGEVVPPGQTCRATEASNSSLKILFPGEDSGAKTHPAPSGPWELPEVCARFAQTPDTGRAAGEQPDILRTDRLFMMTTKVRQNSFTALRGHWNETEWVFSSDFYTWVITSHIGLFFTRRLLGSTSAPGSRSSSSIHGWKFFLFPCFFHLFYVTRHSWDHHERESSRYMVNCCIVKLWASSFGNGRILWIQPEVVLQEFPDARAKNKKNAHEISVKNSVTVSPTPSFVSLRQQKRGEFCVSSDAAKVKLQETKLWKCNEWLIRMARFREVSTFWLVQTTSKDWRRSNMWFQGLGLGFLSIRGLDVMAGLE